MPRSRSTNHAASSSRAILSRCAVAVGLLLLLAPSLAAAQQTKIAVLPINGPAKEAQRVTAELIKLLKKTYDVVPQASWDASAQKLFATSRSADDIGAVATDLGVQVVITGAIKKDPGWTLVLTTRHGPSGKPVDKLRYQLKGAKVDPGTLKKIPDELPPLIDKASVTVPEGTTPEEPPTPTTPEAGGGTTLGEDNESPLEKKEEKKPEDQPRPDWAAWIDGSVGLILGGRNFGFDEADPANPRNPQFKSSIVPGVRFDVTAYPLAFLSKKPGAAMNAVSGLGVGATFDLMLWPDSVPCTARDADGNCVMTADRYPTSEYRLEAGLRWKWNVLAKPGKPELLVGAQYGMHSFSVTKKMDGSDVGPPDVAYSYVTLGLGGRLPIIPKLAILAGFNFHIVLGTGAIQTPEQYGPGGAYGLRVNLGLESRVWKGLTLRVAGYYERFGLSFDNPMVAPPIKMADGGAADQYYGFYLSVGYVF